MDIHLFIEKREDDMMRCLYCNWTNDSKYNGYVKREQAKPHSNWHNYHGPKAAPRRGNFFRGGRSRVKDIPDDILFSTPATILAKLYDVTRSPIDKERRRRRRNGVGSR